MSGARCVSLPGCALIGLLALAGRPVQADHAVVIGINQYPKLQAGSNLSGPVNDAGDMAAFLTKQGFRVTLLADGRATRSGILGAIESVRRSSTPRERFVFYYAGHGTRNSRNISVLLPSDAEERSEQNDLNRDDLFQVVSTLPAKTRTILIDACFSGGMASGYRDLQRVRTGLRMRFYRRGGQAAEPERVNDKDLLELESVPDAADRLRSGVCYFTASEENEQACEDRFGERWHGVFTYYLLQQLGQGLQRWEAISRAVVSNVASHVADLQHPSLSPQFLEKVAFDNVVGAAPTRVATTAWEDYNSDRPDPSKLRLSMLPGVTPVKVNKDVLSFNTTVGTPGYLVILERGVRGNINLLYPKSRSTADARVTAGQVVRIPSGVGFYANMPGTERLKAILFTDEARAAALLGRLPASGKLDDWRGLKDLQEIETAPSLFYTADLSFEVIE